MAKGRTSSGKKLNPQSQTANKLNTDMAEQENQDTNSTTQQPAPRFETVRVYLKDASFEAPASPEVFLQQAEKPKTEVEVLLDYRTLDEASGLIEIVVKITVTSKVGENTLYLAEVHQAGLFQIQHPDPNARGIVMEVTCPHILLPFAREELNNLITKGGFSAFLLAPVNFDALHRNKKEQQQNEKETPVNPESLN